MAPMHPGLLHHTRMAPPHPAILLLLVLPLLSSASFSSTLTEMKESLLEKEGLRSLASFLSIDPEDKQDLEETPLSSSRYSDVSDLL